MRISDWSSDVCSSDLRRLLPDAIGSRIRASCSGCCNMLPRLGSLSSSMPKIAVLPPMRRSEEHTSELQSLMRISYAVFCLKKKKYNRSKYICIYCILIQTFDSKLYTSNTIISVIVSDQHI